MESVILSQRYNEREREKKREGEKHKTTSSHLFRSSNVCFPPPPLFYAFLHSLLCTSGHFSEIPVGSFFLVLLMVSSALGVKREGSEAWTERPQCRPKSHSTPSLDLQLFDNNYSTSKRSSGHIYPWKGSLEIRVNRKKEDVSTNTRIYILHCI